MSASIKHLIINSPYDEPKHHWHYHRETPPFAPGEHDRVAVHSGVAPIPGVGMGLEQMTGGLEHSKGSLEHLQPLAEEARKSKKVSQAAMQQMLVELCRRAPLTAQQLADLLNRDIHSLKNHYLKPMVKAGVLKLLFPDKPNHPDQAYTAGTPPKPTA